MQIEHIGILSPGQMGQILARQLKGRFRIYTSLDGRSDRTRSLAREVGLIDTGSIARLTERCDLILSILNPASALDTADAVARALAANGRKVLYADVNSISPLTMQTIESRITAAGGLCVDASVIGAPRGEIDRTRIYAAGVNARQLEQLAGPQIELKIISDRVGDASALKMCYAAMNKGVISLVLELLIVARRLGVEAELDAQLLETQGAIYGHVKKWLPLMPPRAYRWAPEMREIARTFKEAGLTPRLFEGASDMYEFVARNPLGKETPENRDTTRNAQDVVRLLAELSN